MSLVKLFSSSWVSGSMVGLMATSSKRAYATFCASQVCCTHSPCPRRGHCWPMPLQETLKHSQAGLAQSLVGSLLFCPGSWCTQGCVCALPESLAGMGFDFNVTAPLLLSHCHLSFVLGHGESFFGRFQHPPVNGCSAASCNFGVTAED